MLLIIDKPPEIMMKYFVCLFLLILTVPLYADVTIRDTTITWHTFDYTLAEDYTLESWTDTPYDTVSRTFAGKIIENDLLRIVITSEFGARILSIFFKPTKHEQLYLNPVGAPYGIGEAWFYYKWLMVYGGIFPTLSEPEHGKAWLLPWDFEMISNSPDSVCVKMSWQDTVHIEDINYGKWKYGATGLHCDFIIKMFKNRSDLQTEYRLRNDAEEPLDYEYWTCLTLAPGSDPEEPGCTAGAELIIEADKVKIPSWYPEIASLENKIVGLGNYGQYTFSTLRHYKNWIADGIAYPWDDSNVNYWGIINHDHEEGLIRIANNEITPGIKIWAWAFEESQNFNPWEAPHNGRRPYIELWAGHSREFFEPAQIEANTSKTWIETFIPTVGLKNVTHASETTIADFYIEEGLIHLDISHFNRDENLNIVFDLVRTDSQQIDVLSVQADLKEGNQIAMLLPNIEDWTEQDSIRALIQSESNQTTYLNATIAYQNDLSSINDQKQPSSNTFHLEQNYPNPFNASTTIKYYIDINAYVNITVYNILGESVETLVDGIKQSGSHHLNWIPQLPSGVYYYKLTLTDKGLNHSNTKKLIIIN